jgi:hypothetical protein
MPRVDALLALANALFLAAVFVEVRAVLRGAGVAPPAAPVFPAALSLSFWIFLATVAAGVLDSLASSLLFFFGGRGSLEARAARGRPLVLMGFFWAAEFLWETMLMTGAATSWSLPNAAGRDRPVFPLRYVSWMATNAYIFAALASALRMPAHEASAAVATIVVCTIAAFPLELLPVASASWYAAAAASSSALVVCSGLVMRRVFALAPIASRSHASTLAIVTTVALASYLLFPAIFFSAVLCGGAGPDSCLSVEDEAFWWAIAEGAAKMLVSAAIFLAMASASDFFDRPSRVDLPYRRLRSLVLPPKYATSVHATSWPVDAVLDSLSFLLAVPAFAAAAAFVMLSVLVDASRRAAAGPDVAAVVAIVEGPCCGARASSPSLPLSFPRDSSPRQAIWATAHVRRTLTRRAFTMSTSRT